MTPRQVAVARVSSFTQRNKIGSYKFKTRVFMDRYDVVSHQSEPATTGITDFPKQEVF
jgi:hypothetical protein